MGDLDLVASQLGVPVDFLWLFILIMIWSTVWKGLALWKAAKKGSVPWFILFLIVNTVGILEILYIKVFSKMNFSAKKAKKRKRR